MNVLVVIAHKDDEAYIAGTLLKYKERGYKTTVVVVCGSGNNDHTYGDNLKRNNLFKESCEQLCDNYICLSNNDLTLENLNNSDLQKIKRTLIDPEPTIVITMSEDDQHKDHRIVSKLVKEAFRPYRCDNVKLFMEFCINEDMDRSFKPNRFIDISNYISQKTDILQSYRSWFFLKPKDIEIETTKNKLDGLRMGFDFAESFKIIYQR